MTPPWEALDAATRPLSGIVGQVVRLSAERGDVASDVATVLLFVAMAVALRDELALRRIATAVVALERETRPLPTTPVAVLRVALSRQPTKRGAS